MEQSSEVCLKLAQLLIEGSGDFTQFHSVLGSYELQKNCFEFFSNFRIGGIFV